MERKLLSMLSLSQRAGKLLTGSDTVEEAIKKGNAFFVIIAENASENTKKKFKNKCEYYNVSYAINGKTEEISKAIGKVNRTVVAICDENFANRISELAVT
ncbi:MAG: ribosomal L7Ae/L30e/S12e/Gadd45 family protein [Firmicutes bacterium]|nr:ribosomal L7Ae/L30e/S12e/Gadd45 family protein [Bacillota bacterium]